MSSFTKKIGPLGMVLLVSAALFFVFLVVTGGMLIRQGKHQDLVEDEDEKTSLFSKGSDAVGILELNGVIMDSKSFIKKLEKFGKRERVKAVVLRINSPGGSVAPSQEIYEALKKFEKPIISSMGSVAASGGYYVACATKQIFANPGTLTGSIGVIMQFTNLSKLYEWAKIERYSIKTGKFKDAGADYRAMDPEERALLQGMIDDVLGQFKQAVAEGRKLTPDAVTRVADGRIFSGAQAKTAGLVDQLGTLQDAIAAAGKLGGITGKPKLVYPEKSKRPWLKYLLDESRGEEDGDEESRASFSLTNWIGEIAREALGVRAAPSAASFAPGVYWLWSPAS